jgi:hypothetical protein
MTDWPTPEEMAASIYALMVRNHTPLYGPWKGWRMAGRELVAPDNTRFTPERLRGLAWHQDASARLNSARARNARQKAVRHGATVKVVIVDLADWQQRHLGRLAG